MLLLLIFAFISGLITITAPCIWPILPVILSSTALGGKSKPLGVTLGVCLSFGFLTLALSYIVSFIPIDTNLLRLFAVIIIGVLGVSLVVPAISARMEALVSRLSGNLNGNNSGSGFSSGFITGLTLGIIWSPCAGPILATIATLAATKSVNLQIILVTIFYVAGIGVPLFIFAELGQKIFAKSAAFAKYTGRIQQVFGLIMILTAVAIYFNVDKTAEASLLNTFPGYSNFVNQFEDQAQGQLNQIKNQTTAQSGQGQNAPDFMGITHWLNSDPLTMQQLRGKVVLIDFWTYTCINCIRTLPFVNAWYDKYKEQGFVVVGVHTPEFEFEKDTNNVANAIKEYNIHYPVAQDNNYGTWNAYQNEYWPADYLIDADGKIRDTHFGEGDYDKTEQEIQALLKEKGDASVSSGLVQMVDQTPTHQLTPETYIGLARMERFSGANQPQAGMQVYMPADNLLTDYWDLGGSWTEADQYATSSNNSQLDFHFQASKVYLVMTPQTNSDQTQVLLDGKAIPATEAGKDVQNGLIQFRGADTYNLVDLQGKVESHTLTLQFKTAGTRVFAFTFGD